MNLAIRGIDAQIAHDATFHNRHPGPQGGLGDGESATWLLFRMYGITDGIKRVKLAVLIQRERVRSSEKSKAKS
jgi:hypothetical protein